MSSLSDVLQEKQLHPDISARVVDRFLHGSWDDAVLNAYKTVEERLRAITGSFDSDAMELIKQAFHPSTGILTDPRIWPSEKEGVHQLFRGAFLTFRNSPAHRYTFSNQDEACDAIILANRLYIMIDLAYKNRTSLLNIKESTLALTYPKSDDTGEYLSLDIDNDGKDEIIKTSFGYSGMELEIRKEGSDLIKTIQIGGESLDIVMADVDNDGIKELACVVGHTAGSSLVFYRPSEQGFLELTSIDAQTGEFKPPVFYDAQVADFDGDGRLEIVSEPWDRIPDDLWPKGKDRELQDWGRVRYVYRWSPVRRIFDLVHRELLYVGGR